MLSAQTTNPFGDDSFFETLLYLYPYTTCGHYLSNSKCSVVTFLETNKIKTYILCIGFYPCWKVQNKKKKYKCRGNFHSRNLSIKLLKKNSPKFAYDQ